TKEAPQEEVATFTDDFSPEALAALAESLDSGEGEVQSDSALHVRKPVTFKSGSVLGINIGTDSIKAVELTAKGSSYAVTGVAIAPTPPDSIANGVVMSVNVLADAVKELIAPFKSRKVVTSVAGTGEVIVRIIEVPTMTDAELQENIKTDLDRYIPFPPSEVQWDAAAMRDLPMDPSSSNMDVLLVAARHELIELHLQLLNAIKIDPRAIDVEPLAAARALSGSLSENNIKIDYNDVCAVLNIGASSTEISILRGDELVFTRTVPMGGNMITQALADNLNLTRMDAEHLKREKADASPAQPTVPKTETKAESIEPLNIFDDSINVDVVESGYPAVSDEAALTTEPVEDTSDDAAKNADPFDLDLFNAGPTQNEPDEQHQQKMSDSTANTDDESEVDPSDASLPSKTDDSSVPDATSATGGANTSFFDFEENEVGEQNEQLPTIEGQPQHTEAPPRDDEPGTIDWDDDTYLPSIATSDTLPSAFTFPAISEAVTPVTQAAETPATPVVAQPADFSLVDAPVANAEPTPSASPIPEDEKGALAPPEKKTPAEEMDFSDILGDAAGDIAPAYIDEGLGGTISLDQDASDMGLGDSLSGFGAGLDVEEKPHDEQAVNVLLKPILDDLTSELRRSLEYHSARYPDAPVKRLVLIGGGAKLHNLDTYFSQNLNMPTIVANPFQNLNIDAPQANQQLATEHGSTFVIALGLAMREIIR
ncbi:MAG: type IV pilus assembly protein PilM, partial [Abditibacteriaceae bacterium]